MAQSGFTQHWGLGARKIMTEIGEPQDTTVSIFIVSDEGIPRQALAHLLQARPEYKVVGHSDMAGAEFAACELRPAVVLMHAGNLSARTLGMIKYLSARNIPVVVLLRQRNPWLAHACHRAGATGLVLLEAAPVDLFSAVNAAAVHKRSVDPLLAGALFDTGPGLNGAVTPDLSARESQVLRYLAYGYSNVEIARKLKVSTKSVETYRARLMEKLDFKGRTDIVRFALMTGILSPNDVDDVAS